MDATVPGVCRKYLFLTWKYFSKELWINFTAFTSMSDIFLLGTSVSFLFLTQQLGIYHWCV